jgi:digeranylgeranylglycerophospholipid reductase
VKKNAQAIGLLKNKNRKVCGVKVLETCSERSESACSERSESTCSERSESACSERSESACSERSESTCSERSESACSERSESTCSERSESTCSERSESNGKEKEYEAGVIIGADGVESYVARWAGMDFSLELDQIEACVQYLLGDVEVESDCVEFHLGQNLAPGGYTWVFPKANNRANVGLAMSPDRTSGKKAKEYLDQFVPKRFSNFKIIESMVGAVPCFDRNRNLVKENVLLVGDAGRVVDSLSGAGISNALLSGEIAGSVVSQYIKNGGLSVSFLRKYYDELMRSKGRLLRFHSFCRAIFLKMTDEDLDAVILFLKRCFDGKVVTSLEPIPIVKSIFRSNPRLLLLLRHLVW